jgi:hypothetical protein
MRIPKAEEVQELAALHVGKWLIEECKKIFGEDIVISANEDIKSKLENAGYTLDRTNMGLSISYLLKKESTIVSKYTVNIMDLTMELAKK